MNPFRLFSRSPRETPAEKKTRLEHKLEEVRKGRYLIKPSDHSLSLAELEQKLVREISKL